ncbi:protein transport protein BET1 [Amylostereum chailletii]|nr:protein transport protein BET1 [Amylostereum chailletii]
MSQRYRPAARTHLGLNEYGMTPPHSGRSSPLGGAGTNGTQYAHGARFADDLEGQNDEAIEGLSAKVKMLKDITIGIGNEVRESTHQLSQMNDAFSETSGILAGTFRRMNNMAERQGCRWLWYIVFLTIVFWFFLFVWWLRR